ncbi:MAG: bifunctional [glutamine synthetase] adenylyltransferase/[glutamine synthetase]-adenylyl-L-tyrosine phosphorylase [Alphaproteobacteria bacterium]
MDWMGNHGKKMDERSQHLIASTMIASPFLATLIEKWPDFAYQITAGQGDQAHAHIQNLLAQVDGAEDMTTVSSKLREARTRFALLCALQDISGHWSVMEAAGYLSSFADKAVQAATNFLLRRAALKDELALPDITTPAQGSGLVILAMGKFGAHELNYSSDIDLIILFDHKGAPYLGRKDAQQFFVRFAKDLSHLLQERTGDGYVFRVDLRLRPDASMTAPALPLAAATAYYESTGETWERSAMIKARPVAGDIGLGAAFLKEIRPFVWRGNLDFAALDDVMNVTRQIRSARREPATPPAGVNVKLGRGGIREAEFFVQAQQLIHGGRERHLRRAATLDGLNALQDHGFVEHTTAEALAAAYVFLRQVEHRLQMVQDEQTQTLPGQQPQLAQLVRFLGFNTIEEFATTLETHRQAIASAFDALFDNAGLANTEPKSDVSTAPDAVAESLGYTNPVAVKEMVERWQSGTYRAFRSERARSVARDMTETILQRFSVHGAGDKALTRFDGFLSQLPAGVQLFTLLRAHDWLLDELLAVLSTAPELALMLERKPVLLDILLDSDSDERVQNKQLAEADLSFLLASARSYEEVLDYARRWYRDHKFLIGVRQIAGRMNAQSAGAALANCLEATMRCLKVYVEDTFTKQHGRLPGGSFGIVALGKFGTRDLTATSDADLIFIYDFDTSAKQSDGPRPLSPGQYFQRLGQRMVTAMSAPTAEGSIVEIDMRMRPQGNSGPLCTRVDSFEAYFGEGGKAWTYEKQALLKARVITAAPLLEARITATIDANHRQQRDEKEVRCDVAAMRARMDGHFKTRDPWALKHVRGGMVDIEFLLQALVLIHDEDGTIDLRNSQTAITQLATQGILTQEDADLLAAAQDLYTTVQSLKRLCLTGKFDVASLPPAFATLLLKATRADTLETLEQRLLDYQHRVQSVFHRELPSSASKDAVPPDLSFD